MKTNRESIVGKIASGAESTPFMLCRLWSLAGAALLSIVATATLLLSGCTSTKAAEAVEEAPTVSVQVGPVEVTKIQRKVIAEAVLYPKDQAAIVPKISAPVKKFFVD